jgi:hypothetical protein
LIAEDNSIPFLAGELLMNCNSSFKPKLRIGMSQCVYPAVSSTMAGKSLNHMGFYVTRKIIEKSTIFQQATFDYRGAAIFFDVQIPMLDG